MMSRFNYLILCFFILPFCRGKTNLTEAKKEIQAILYRDFQQKFRIDRIEPDYNPDMFHEQWGFKTWLIDSSGISFGPVFFEYNKYQKGWITYGGSNISKQYEEAKSNNKIK